MATQAPEAPVKKLDADRAQPNRPLPDQSTWRRYSQHGEFPLSTVGSLALHILALAIIFIAGFKIFGDKKRKELPVEPIKIGGKGTGRGEGRGNNVGDGSDVEDGTGKGDGSQKLGPPEDTELKLDQDVIKALPPNIRNDPNAMRAIKNGDPKVIGRLSEDAQAKLRSGTNPGGNNGTGNLGGNIGGTTGDGPGKGTGSERAKRLVRWSIHFDTSSTAAYVAQLRAMGATIGLPSGKDTLKTIRDLKPPARIVDDDPMKLGLLPWYNNDPQSAAAVLRELGVNVQVPFLVVFFPRDLEEQFAKAEREYQGLPEDQIEETVFILLRGAGGKLVPKVERQKKK